MAGYNDTRNLIIEALMGRQAGTEIQPAKHQAYALNMLDYVRSVELVSSSTLVGLAEESTVPIQPNQGKVCYIAGVGQDRTVTFSNFIDGEGNPISITTGEMEGVFVILLWNMEHWVAYTFNTNIISSAESANFYYGYNIRKTYASVAAMNADSVNPIGTDGRLIKIGELVTVVNSTTPAENGYYSYEGSENGWMLQSGFSFEIVQTTGTDINKAMSQKAVTDEITQLEDDVNLTFENMFAPRKNLFDKNTMVDDGHYLGSGDGGVDLATDWGCTTPIKVKDSTQYAITTPYYGSGMVVSFYDSSMNLLSFTIYQYVVTTPAGCAYLRFSLYRNTTKSSFISSNVQLEEGSVATAVVPYQLTVNGVFKGTQLFSYTSEDAAQMKAEIDADIAELDTKIGTTQTNIELGPYLSYEDSVNYSRAAKLVKRAWIENPVEGKTYFIYNIAADVTNAAYGYALRIAYYTTDINAPTPVGVFANIQNSQDIYEEIIRVLADGAILHIWIDWSKIDGNAIVQDYSIKWVFSKLCYQVPVDYIKSQLDPLFENFQFAVDKTKGYDQILDIKTPENNNLLNPLTITPNVVLIADGTTTGGGAGPSYDTSDFIAVSPSTDYKGLRNTNAGLSFRFVCFYNENKVFLSILDSSSSFTTPANCAYIRVSWNNGLYAVTNIGVFLSTVATFSVFEFPYIELAPPKDIDNKTDKELVSKGDVNNLINTALSHESGDINLQISTTPNADVVIADGDITVTMAVNQSINYQGLINFAGVDVFGLVYTNFDDIAPVHIQNYTVGANHGWRGDVLTCVGHGLTESNVGDELTANDGVKFTVMKINSVDTFTVLRENGDSSIYVHSNAGWDGQTSLTDGVTTYTITDSTSTQYYPSVNKKYVKIFKDRKEVVGYGSFNIDIAELVEEYDILNKESLRLNAAAPENALSSINVKNTYQFRKGGISYVFCRYKIGHELVFSNIMAAQAVMISTAGYLYAPKIMTFADNVDLRRLTLFSALGGNSRIFSDTLWETGKIPNRVTNYTADKTKALMLGILTDRGVGKNLASFTKDTFEIRGSSGKTYPHPVSSTAVGSTLTGGEIYDIAMFRAYFEPIGNVDKVELPLESKTIVIVDIHEVGTFTVKLSDNLNGGLINVTDSQNAIMHGDIVINSEIEITTSSDYSYIEFEVS